MERCDARRGRRQRHRQGRGRGARPPAPADGRDRAARAGAPLRRADQRRPGRAAPGARRRRKVHLRYRDGEERRQRSAPCGRSRLSFYGPVWLLAAWCELRATSARSASTAWPPSRSSTRAFRPERGKTLHDFLRRDESLIARRATPRAPLPGPPAPDSAAGRPRSRTSRSGSRSRCGGRARPPSDRRGSPA